MTSKTLMFRKMVEEHLKQKINCSNCTYVTAFLECAIHDDPPDAGDVVIHDSETLGFCSEWEEK